MRKLVNFLMSVATGIDVALSTFEQLAQPPPPQPPPRKSMGFTNGVRPTDEAVWVQPVDNPWINGDKSKS